MKKKKLLIGLGALAILGGGAYVGVPALHEESVVSSEIIKMKDFKELENQPFEIMHTASFTDKNLEKWFNQNEKKQGETLYYDNEYTYVLISPGEKEAKGKTIWFDGLKSSGKTTLIAGYKMVDASELGISTKENKLPTLLVRTKGEFKEVTGIKVQQEKIKIPAPKVTSKEMTKTELDKEKASKKKGRQQDETSVKSERDFDKKETKEKEKSDKDKKDKKEKDDKE